MHHCISLTLQHCYSLTLTQLIAATLQHNNPETQEFQLGPELLLSSTPQWSKPWPTLKGIAGLIPRLIKSLLLVCLNMFICFLEWLSPCLCLSLRRLYLHTEPDHFKKNQLQRLSPCLPRIFSHKTPMCVRPELGEGISC